MTICDDNGDVNEDNNEDDNDGDDNTTTMATIDDDDVDEDGGGYAVGEETRASNTSGRFTDRQPALCTAERGAFPVKWVVQTDKSGGVCSDSQRI